MTITFSAKSLRVFSITLSICFFTVNITQAQNSNQELILTPKPCAEPRINGPKVFGVRPGHPILFTIPASGNKPMTFSARKLPKGIRVDSKSGKISGTINRPGTYII